MSSKELLIERMSHDLVCERNSFQAYVKKTIWYGIAVCVIVLKGTVAYFKQIGNDKMAVKITGTILASLLYDNSAYSGDQVWL